MFIILSKLGVSQKVALRPEDISCYEETRRPSGNMLEGHVDCVKIHRRNDSTVYVADTMVEIAVKIQENIKGGFCK